MKTCVTCHWHKADKAFKPAIHWCMRIVERAPRIDAVTGEIHQSSSQPLDRLCYEERRRTGQIVPACGHEGIFWKAIS